MTFASLKSSNPKVRARLQAALFTNRKRNKVRREAGGSPNSGWGVGIFVMGKDPDFNRFGFRQYNYGSVSKEANEAFPLINLINYVDDGILEIWFSGDCTAFLNGKKIVINGLDYHIDDVTPFEGGITQAYSNNCYPATLSDLSNSFTFSFA